MNTVKQILYGGARGGGMSYRGYIGALGREMAAAETMKNGYKKPEKWIIHSGARMIFRPIMTGGS